MKGSFLNNSSLLIVFSIHKLNYVCKFISASAVVVLNLKVHDITKNKFKKCMCVKMDYLQADYEFGLVLNSRHF